MFQRLNLLLMNDLKTCKKCLVSKPLAQYHKDITKLDGYHNRCRTCRGCKERGFVPTCGLKQCSKCLEIKIEEEDFSFASKKAGRRSARCKACIKAVSDNWYQNNKIRHNNTSKKSRRIWGEKARDVNKRLLEELKARPCLDCGIQYSPWMMQFDHREGHLKKGNLSTMAHNCKPTEAILAEAEKCDVVCANCHADRTYRRRMSLKVGV